MEKRLYRSRTNRMLGGVCAGIAEYIGADPTLVRLIWALISLFPPTTLVGIGGYLIAWLIIPEAPAQ